MLASLLLAATAALSTQTGNCNIDAIDAMSSTGLGDRALQAALAALPDCDNASSAARLHRYVAYGLRQGAAFTGESFSALERAARLGDPLAMGDLALALVDQDVETAAKWSTRAVGYAENRFQRKALVAVHTRVLDRFAAVSVMGTDGLVESACAWSPEHPTGAIALGAATAERCVANVRATD